MQYFGLAAIFCSITLLLSAYCSVSALPSGTDHHALTNEQSFLMNLIGKLSKEALKMTSDVKGSSQLTDSEIQQEVSCPDSLPKCDPQPRYKSCTGIAFDSTDSMQPEIALLKEILIADLKQFKQVYRSEQHISYCYAFMEVNNYKVDTGENVVATSDDHPKSLDKLIDIVSKIEPTRVENGMEVYGVPHKENRTLRHWEEQFKAIRKLQKKKRTDDDSVSLMRDGQIVLITNSNTWDKELLEVIVNSANKDNTCFSMFIPEYTVGERKYKKGDVLTDPNAPAVNYYEQLVNELKKSNRIGDVQLDPKEYKPINFAKFLAVRAGTQCRDTTTQPPHTEQPEFTGSDPDYPYCGSVTVNPLTSILRIVAYGVGDKPVSLRVTSPGGEKSFASPKIVTSFRQEYPSAGVWEVCGNKNFQFFVGHVAAIEAKPSYRVYNACDDQQRFESEPKICTIGQASFCANVNDLPERISTAKLVTRRKDNFKFEITDSHNLEFCNNVFYSDNFLSPDQEGSYKFTIEGLDINSKEYAIDVGTKTVLNTIPFKVTVSPTEFANLTIGDSFEVRYTATSQVDYCFSVSITRRETAGIELGPSPSIIELSPQDNQHSFTLRMEATGANTPGNNNVIPLAFDAVVSAGDVEIGGCRSSARPVIVVNIRERLLEDCERELQECRLMCGKGLVF